MNILPSVPTLAALYQGSDSLPAAVTNEPKRSRTRPVSLSTVPETPGAVIVPSSAAVAFCVPPAARAYWITSEPGRIGAAAVRNTYSLEMFSPTVVTQLWRVMELVAPGTQEVSVTSPVT